MFPVILYFFNSSRIAEPIRYLLTYCGITFEDLRFREADWYTSYKRNMPVKQVPVLEIDGIQIHQHLCICRYIVDKYAPELRGSDPLETCRINEIVEDLNDVRIEICTWFDKYKMWREAPYSDRTESEFLAQKRWTLEHHKSIYYDQWEIAVRKNKWLVGKNMTFADIYFAAISETLEHCLGVPICGKNCEKDSALQKLIQNVRKIESIANYIATRRAEDSWIG